MQQQVEHPAASIEHIVARVDEAVRQPTTEAITESLTRCLCRLASEGSLSLPAEICTPCAEHYARRLLHRSDELGYAMVAMIWGPDQGTALHDHAGTWCVEGVVEGTIEVTRYELVEHSGERWRFQRRDTVQTGIGTAGSLIPPFEYHTIRNASDETTAITLHVYGSEMDHCSVFEPQETSETDGACWYARRVRRLSYDR